MVQNTQKYYNANDQNYRQKMNGDAITGDSMLL